MFQITVIFVLFLVERSSTWIQFSHAVDHTPSAFISIVHLGITLREIGKQAGRIGRKRMFHAVSSFKKVYMFPSYILCKGFNPVRQLSTSTDFNCELFLKQCMDLIDKRGHCRIRLGETVLNTKGEPVSFDITYGWPFRHYCKCNFSNDPVSFEQIKEFEVGLRCVLYLLEFSKVLWNRADSGHLF